MRWVNVTISAAAMAGSLISDDGRMAVFLGIIAGIYFMAAMSGIGEGPQTKP